MREMHDCQRSRTSAKTGDKQAHVTHRALLGKGAGDGTPDACGRASHDSDLAC